MFLTLFYLVATWLQSNRLVNLKMRLYEMLQGPEETRPTIMFSTSSPTPLKEDSNATKSKTQHENQDGNHLLSSNFCVNKHEAKLGDLLWYQGEKRLCTIFPQQEIDVSTWLVYPPGMSSFPLFAYNNNYGQRQIKLNDSMAMHVLVEADLHYNPVASTKATKLEDYGLIVTWTTDETFAVIIETDLDRVTKFSTSLMHGQCFINNGLSVLRVESVKASGKPCSINISSESRKLIGKCQWDSWVKKLRAIGFAGKLVAQRNEAIQLRECGGVTISPGCKPLSLNEPTILEIETPNNDDEKRGETWKAPDAAATTTNGKSEGDDDKEENEEKASPRIRQILKYNVDLSPSISIDSSTTTSWLSNLNIFKSTSKYNAEDDSGVNLCCTGTTNSRDNLVDQLIEEESCNKTLAPASNEATIGVSSSSLIDTTTAASTVHQVGETKSESSVLVYADSATAVENIKNVLSVALDDSIYGVRELTTEEAKRGSGMEEASLIVVYGNVGGQITSQLVDHLLQGGKMLALCSDALHILLPSFKTAEVRENELVRFSYGKWKHVRMLHHIFCYQASPVRTKFHDDCKSSATPLTPEKSVVTDRNGNKHTFDVQVLGAEETWQTPSILLAQLPCSGAKAVFSQIHLEADPSQYEIDRDMYNALKQSNSARLEIFRHLLNTHLGIDVLDLQDNTTDTGIYTSAFFLGRHELKLEMLKELKDKMQPEDVLKTAKMHIQFCKTGTKTRKPSAKFLPVMIHQCPDNFSTVEYFENLKSKDVGRLVIYSDILASLMNVLDGCKIHHGLAVIPKKLENKGTSAWIWTNDQGSVFFTVQLHIAPNSPLASRVALVQHLVSLAVVQAIKALPGYENINLSIKWPNNVCTGDSVEIGGALVTSFQEPNCSTIICNASASVNLSSHGKSPKTCINDVIVQYNQAKDAKLKQLTYERFLALVFNEIENYLDVVQAADFPKFLENYHRYWLHSDKTVKFTNDKGSSQSVRIQGIDDFGSLKVTGSSSRAFTINPDEYTFDVNQNIVARKN